MSSMLRAAGSRAALPEFSVSKPACSTLATPLLWQ
jgi:hypothetical protein